MHRIQYQTITENDPKNMSEQLEFTISSVNDRQFIDLYNSYISFDYIIKCDTNDDITVEPFNTTLPGIFEQCNLDVIYIDNQGSLQNGTFESILNAPDYRQIIAALFNNNEKQSDEEHDGNTFELRIGIEEIYYDEIDFKKHEDSSGTFHKHRFRIPFRYLFELANNEFNTINFKEINFKMRFKDPLKYIRTYDDDDKTWYINGTSITPMAFLYDNVKVMYHYYQDLETAGSQELKNTPMQAFRFPLGTNSFVKKQLLMNDVYRYLVVFCTKDPENFTSLVDNELQKITMGSQGKSFFSEVVTHDLAWDYTTFCINSGKHSRIYKDTYYRDHFLVLPLDEIIDYDAPSFLDFEIKYIAPSSGTLHLLFFGK